MDSPLALVFLGFIVLRRLPEVESALDDTMRKSRRTTGLVEPPVIKPLVPLASAVALWKGLKRGVSVFRADPIHG